MKSTRREQRGIAVYDPNRPPFRLFYIGFTSHCDFKDGSTPTLPHLLVFLA